MDTGEFAKFFSGITDTPEDLFYKTSTLILFTQTCSLIVLHGQEN